jgi:putative transcriptional regulator
MVPTDLAPGLLLAAPSLHDPNFQRTVILLGRSGDEGALGWVINGRELMTVSELFTSSDLVPEGTAMPTVDGFGRCARVGGPVAPAAGWLVYRRLPEALAGEIALGPELAVSGDLSTFTDLLRGLGPQDFRLILGCAGWAPRQLESEIGAGAWLPAGVDADLVFETPLEEIWDQAYRRTVGTRPAAFTNPHGRA